MLFKSEPRLVKSVADTCIVEAQIKMLRQAIAAANSERSAAEEQAVALRAQLEDLRTSAAETKLSHVKVSMECGTS